MNASNEPFLGLSKDERPGYEKASAVIVPFPLEASVCYGGGTKNGPKEIIKASYELETFDETFWCEPYKFIGIETFETLKTDQKSIKDSLQVLEKTVDTLLTDGKFPLILGGEHSLTSGAIRPFIKRHKDLVLLHFDAHADLRDGYLGEFFSHASAIRRCLDHKNISVVSLGIRNISTEEAMYLDENKNRIQVFWAKDRAHFHPSQLKPYLSGKTVYVTFDVDGLDPSLIPATGTPEPGGLLWEEVIDVLTYASSVSKIVGADVCELSPISKMHSPNFIIAKLVYKILTFAFCNRLPKKG